MFTETIAQLESPQFTPSPADLKRRQQDHLAAFITRYSQRTPTSKQLTQTYRPVLADVRGASGFRQQIKEIVYPIIGKRAAGAKIWDVDDNEYIDLVMGFGINLFGHNPPFLQQALAARLEQGIQIGPQSDLAGEVAQLISQLTGMERVTFSNTGTEAVMTALRLARAATGRSKIVMFSGSYHGHFDGTLAKTKCVDGDRQTIPEALGVLPEFVQDVLVLDYGHPESLEVIQQHQDQLAAVLVEPVQNSRLDLQPQEFLQELRQITQKAGIALIFDEILTGFRIHLGGAQAWFGVTADIATYGKIIGGGMPIGVIAGRAEYMNYIDGGLWHYGDDSAPGTATTFFAGTYCKHPLALAAAKAVLQYLQLQGPGLQEQLNQKTTHLINRLNAHFEQAELPIRLAHCGSLFNAVPVGGCQPTNPAFSLENLDLIYYHLRDRGVLIRSGGGALSTAHTDADLDQIVQALQSSLEELHQGGFLPSFQATANSGANYDPFARFYNQYWGQRYCQQDLPVFAQLLFPHLTPADPILELGCGTGHLAKQLLLNGYRVTGVDQSQAMLDYARINAPGGQFIQTDLAYLDFPPSFTGVISTAVLNHMMSLEALSNVFDRVYKALVAGGIFVFNLTQEERYLTHWQGYLDEGDIQAEYAWATRVSYNPENRIGEIEVFIFQLVDGQWQRTETLWPVRSYPRDEVISALEKAGFVNIKMYDAEQDLAISNAAGEAFFVCWKPQ